MGPDSQWGDTRDGFGVSGIHEIQRNPNFFSDSWESGYFAKKQRFRPKFPVKLEFGPSYGMRLRM